MVLFFKKLILFAAPGGGGGCGEQREKNLKQAQLEMRIWGGESYGNRLWLMNEKSDGKLLYFCYFFNCNLVFVVKILGKILLIN